MELTDALSLARALMHEHGLTDWTVRLDRAKTRAGACRYRTREITLSAHLTRLHSEAEVRDTILHEIAHAMVGPGHGHDAAWRRTARAIGSSGERCSAADAPRVAGAWRGTCAGGHTVTRHRAPTRVTICTMCAGPDRDRIFHWTHHGRTVSMHPNYRAELGAVLRGPTAGFGHALAPGHVVRVTAPGQWDGTVGPILKRGRTRYHVQVDGGVLTVPFAWVERIT